MGDNIKDQEVRLKIILNGSKPPIWRRVSVNSSITFEELHYTIQITMGWGIYHLYEFKINDYRVGVHNDEMKDFGYGSSDLISSSEITLKEILDKDIKEFTYEYDFGDSWIHRIEIEKILSLDPKTYYPYCLNGKQNCPPEDCGGIPGFYYLLEVLSDKKHPEHQDMKDWLNGEYDPDEFDLEETNMFLREIKEIMDEEEDNF